MEEIEKTLRWLFNALCLWLQCAWAPIATLNEILQGKSDESCLSAALKVWTFSLLIALIPMFPVLNFYGIGPSNIYFYLSNWVITILNVVVTVFITHRVLLLMKLSSEFVRTLAMFTTPVITYSPIIVLINLPLTILEYDWIKALRKENLPLADVAMRFLRTILTHFFASHGGFITTIEFFLQLFSLALIAVFAEAVSQWYGNDRFKSYSAVTVALLLSGVATWCLFVPAQLLVIYSFIS